MTLENVYYIGQTIAVIVIVATLIAILQQGRQANRIARASLTNELWTSFGGVQMDFYRASDDAAFMRRALMTAEKLTDVEKDRFSFTMISLFGMIESAHILHSRGFLEEQSLVRLDDTLRYYLSYPRTRRWWSKSRERVYRPPFRDFVDAIVATYEPASAVRKAG